MWWTALVRKLPASLEAHPSVLRIMRKVLGYSGHSSLHIVSVHIFMDIITQVRAWSLSILFQIKRRHTWFLSLLLLMLRRAELWCQVMTEYNEQMDESTSVANRWRSRGHVNVGYVWLGEVESIWTPPNLSLYGNTSGPGSTHNPTGPIKHKETL